MWILHGWTAAALSLLGNEKGKKKKKERIEKKKDGEGKKRKACASLTFHQCSPCFSPCQAAGRQARQAAEAPSLHNPSRAADRGSSQPTGSPDGRPANQATPIGQRWSQLPCSPSRPRLAHTKKRKVDKWNESVEARGAGVNAFESSRCSKNANCLCNLAERFPAQTASTIAVQSVPSGAAHLAPLL